MADMSRAGLVYFTEVGRKTARTIHITHESNPPPSPLVDAFNLMYPAASANRAKADHRQGPQNLPEPPEPPHAPFCLWTLAHGRFYTPIAIVGHQPLPY